jgi:hypothetical protein
MKIGHSHQLYATARARRARLSPPQTYLPKAGRQPLRRNERVRISAVFLKLLYALREIAVDVRGDDCVVHSTWFGRPQRGKSTSNPRYPLCHKVNHSPHFIPLCHTSMNEENYTSKPLLTTH